jgi:hypothetical protein
MQAERLDHQVVGAKIEAAYTGVDLLAGRQDQNREVEVKRSDFFKNLLTVLDRHVQIQDCEVRQILPKGLDGVAAIVDETNAMSIGLKPAAQKQSQCFVVLCDQQPHSHSLLGVVRTGVD